MNTNLNLNGYNPLAYAGVNASSPSQFVVNSFSPTPTDYANFIIGAEWLNNITLQVYKLVSKISGIAKWVELTSGTGTVITLEGNTGGLVPANASGNIMVIGDGTSIQVTGIPGTNTLSISAIGSGVLETLTGNSGGAVSPNSSGNINVVGDSTISFTGNPGTNTLTASVTGAAGWTTGTFTPTLAFAGVSTGITYSSQLGKYWKSGPMVFISVFIQLTSNGGLTGSLTMSGLPFTSANDNFDQLISALMSGVNPVTSSGSTPYQGYIPFNSNVMSFYTTASSGGFPVVTQIVLANTSSVQLSGFYWTS